MKSILFILIILLSAALVSHGEELPRGVIVKKVVCLEDKQQSYALYLPSNYTPEKKWPAILIFDPDGEGSTPVGIFKAAAEKYGFIVIGSNNNRNGLGSEKQAGFIKGLWKDTHARLAIDLQRTYAAGYSGGARLANNFAWSCKGCIAGVISCGAGFPPEFPLGKDLPYAIFGTAGTNDFNYPEMVKLDRTLAKLGVPHNFASFEGGHEWLTEELALEAVEWFDLQAMKTNRLAKNAAFIKDNLSKRQIKADSLIKNGLLLGAYQKYDSIARDATGLINDPDIVAKAGRITEERAYKDALKQENELFERQTATVKNIISQAVDLLDPNTKLDAARAISTELNKLRELSLAKADSGERRFARRTLRALLAESNESAMYIYMKQKDYKSAAANFELASLVYPGNMYIEINRARALALGGRKKEAVEALEKAVEKGFKDCALLSEDEAFTILQNNKDFLKLKTTVKCAE